ncbi:hypothetical protein [Pedobacter sp. G11]|uniref:hypothetical protein n=1 Tax=Pedobacter sp. G11 TaxID=2482728 RepID=UPI00143D1AA7|nr:hypothetical protein [Pedobacter sp. G11]
MQLANSLYRKKYDFDYNYFGPVSHQGFFTEEAMQQIATTTFANAFKTASN